MDSHTSKLIIIWQHTWTAGVIVAGVAPLAVFAVAFVSWGALPASVSLFSVPTLYSGETGPVPARAPPPAFVSITDKSGGTHSTSGARVRVLTAHSGGAGIASGTCGKLNFGRTPFAQLALLDETSQVSYDLGVLAHLFVETVDGYDETVNGIEEAI